MTEAPKRIWASPRIYSDRYDWSEGEWQCEYGEPVEGEIEYVRIDIHREALMQMLASSGQAQDAYIAQGSAEAERDALAARVKELEAALKEIAEFESANRWEDTECHGMAAKALSQDNDRE